MKLFLIVVARLAILLVSCGVVFGVGSWAVLRPGPQLENAKHENTLHGLQRKVNEGRAAKRALPLFREEMKRLEHEAQERLATSPAGGGFTELLSQLRRISTASGVTLQRHERSTAASNDSDIAARITLRGSTRQVLAFFAAIRDDKYPFIADDLELFRVEDGTDVLQADLVVISPLALRTTSRPDGSSE